MQFRRLATVDFVASAVSGSAAIIAAVVGAGLWSLVVQILTLSGVQSCVLWFASDWRPRWLFDRSAMRELWGFSRNIAAFNAVNYWLRNGDNLLIGKVLGAVPLGIYTRAYTFSMLPLTQIAAAATRVMFPTLSRIQTDHERVRAAYVRANAMIALVAFPFAIGLFVMADTFTDTVLGPKWAAVSPILRILCVAALLQSVGTTVGWIYQSQGRSDWMFRWSLGAGTVVLAAFGIGVIWGLKGVAIAYVFATALLVPLSFVVSGRLIGLRLMDIVKAVRGVFLAASAMGVVVWVFGLLMDGVLSASPLFASEVAVAGLTYAVLVHALSLKPYRDLKNLISPIAP
jgi:PST family polysaccharide transporter